MGCVGDAWAMRVVPSADVAHDINADDRREWPQAIAKEPTTMDPNLMQATIYHFDDNDRDRYPLHLERELVVYKPTRTGFRQLWTGSMRRRSGARLIRLGQRLQGRMPLVQPDRHAGVATSDSA
jgi:hypothetical protein